MADHPRIEELRRRVQRDKASIAFAQLAEEYRRAGRLAEAIDTCRTGLAHHPGYLSAHVTLGRALIETGELQLAQDELTRVHTAAPENLAAIKGLAEIHHRRGERQEALALYARALQLGPHDPELEHLVGVVTHEMPADAPPPVDMQPVAVVPARASDANLPAAQAAETGSLAAASVSASDAPVQPDPHTLDARAPQQIEALERWLDAILADRNEQR